MNVCEVFNTLTARLTEKKRELRDLRDNADQMKLIEAFRKSGKTLEEVLAMLEAGKEEE